MLSALLSANKGGVRSTGDGGDGAESLGDKRLSDLVTARLSRDKSALSAVGAEGSDGSCDSTKLFHGSCKYSVLARTAGVEEAAGSEGAAAGGVEGGSTVSEGDSVELSNESN